MKMPTELIFIYNTPKKCSEIKVKEWRNSETLDSHKVTQITWNGIQNAHIT